MDNNNGIKTLITAAEFERRMKELWYESQKDPEGAHINADELLCKTLESLGYSAGVDYFKDMKRWYS